jgi:uncharacterized NAD(P)/FAD-binding protein YdhS
VECINCDVRQVRKHSSSRDDDPGTEIFATLGFLFGTGPVTVQHQNIDIAIIGGGATGVLLAIQLLRQSLGPLNITLIDRGPDIGVGVAYATQCANHLLNIPAADMSALPDDPDHFVRWLSAEESRESWTCDAFVPRRTYGRYLRSLLSDAVRQSAGRLSVMMGEVTAATVDRTRVQLSVDGTKSMESRAAILATGNHPPSDDYGAYRGNPWRLNAIGELAPSASVLLIGTGLTMIDVIISLAEKNHTGQIIALSRRGLLPRAHPIAKPAPASCQTEILFSGSLSTRLRRFRAMARRQEGWDGIMQALRPHNAALWHSLNHEQRRRFLRHLRPWWDVHRHRVAPSAGRTLDAMMASGQLQTIAGRVAAMDVADTLARVSIVRRGARDSEAHVFDRIIDCRGPRNGLDSRSPVQVHLAKSGLLRTDRLELGLDVTMNGALETNSGMAATRLFALGPPTKGRHWEINAIPDIRRHAAEMAKHLVESVVSGRI